MTLHYFLLSCTKHGLSLFSNNKIITSNIKLNLPQNIILAKICRMNV